jgi:DNA mismatch endonuclease, patch repair protein
MLLATALKTAGVRARKQAKELAGSPDMVLDDVRIALFVDGDFWHGRQWFEHGLAPVQNREFWIAKFRANRERDRAADARLRHRGWCVMRLWASDLKRHPELAVARVRKQIERRRGKLKVTHRFGARRHRVVSRQRREVGKRLRPKER